LISGKQVERASAFGFIIINSAYLTPKRQRKPDVDLVKRTDLLSDLLEL
jgi:hypothetical protein